MSENECLPFHMLVNWSILANFNTSYGKSGLKFSVSHISSPKHYYFLCCTVSKILENMFTVFVQSQMVSKYFYIYSWSLVSASKGYLVSRNEAKRFFFKISNFHAFNHLWKDFINYIWFNLKISWLLVFLRNHYPLKYLAKTWQPSPIMMAFNLLQTFHEQQIPKF